MSLFFKINFLNPQSSQFIINHTRFAHYIVNQKGEKVIVSRRTAIRTKKEKWQKVQPMGMEDEFKKIKQIEKDERLHCDPKQARLMAENKFNQLENRLTASGLCRETKPYHPPDNINEIISNICKELLKTSRVSDLDSLCFSDMCQKFKFLARCYLEFDHEVKNSDLHLMKSVGDVRNYYLQPVRGVSRYDELAFKSLDLPPNLHVIPEPIRFNPKTDTFFDGVNAFPGSVPELVGLRAKKKYPSYKDNFIWPDV